MRTRLRLPALLLAAPLSLVLLAACGDEAGAPAAQPSPSDTAAAATCESIWVAGETLPRGYDGCRDASGEQHEARAIRCSSGQRYFTFADRFYAVPGAPVQEAADGLADDRDYQRVRNRCRG